MKSEELFKEIQFLMTKPALLEAVEAVANYSGTLTATASEIIRQAVMRVGSADAFKQNGQPFVFAAKFYDQTVKEILSEYDWRFARHQSPSIGKDGTPPISGHSSRYALPAGTLKVLRVNGIDNAENFGLWEIVGSFIHTSLGGGFAIGEKIQFTNLPASSNLSSSAIYIVNANPSSTTFSITDINGAGIAISNTSITANTTQAVSVTGSFSATITSLNSGVFTYTSLLSKNINVDYIAAPANDSSYPAIFIEMVVVRLAYKLALALGANDQAMAAAKEFEFLVQRPSLQREIVTVADASVSNSISTRMQICKQAIMRLGNVEDLKSQPMVFANSFYDHTLEELLAELPWGFAKKQTSISANATGPSQGYSKRYALPTDFIQLLRVNNIDTTENFGQWEIVGGYIHSDLGGGFSVGEEVQFTNLPAGSNLSSTTTYLISANPSNNTFNISDSNGNGLAISNSSITANVTEVSSTSGPFTAKISNLVSGTFTYASPQNQNIKLDYTANITDVALFPAPFIEALIARIAAKIALPLTGKADIASAMATIAAESINRPTIQVLVEKSSKPRATSSANSVAEICRQAILRVGSADQFKPYGEPMVIAQSLYEQTRNEVLADFDWQFARVQSSITADPTPPAFGYTTRYALPAGTLKVLRVNGVDEDENFGNWEIVGGYLHTNYTTPVKIETTKIIEDTEKFPPVFTNMLTVTLAFKLSQLLEIQVAKN